MKIPTKWIACFYILAMMSVSQNVLSASSDGPYLETFDGGTGGWLANRYDPLPVWDGAAYCYSPWYLDSNHAPPGAGYLHLLMYLYTDKALPQDHLGKRGNHFIEQNKSTNLTNAKLSVRLRGQVDLQGSQLLLLVQARAKGTTSNYVLSQQPLEVTPKWGERTLNLVPDGKQWKCLGSRWDLKDRYGCTDIETVLRDVNVDIIFVLFPLKVIPAGNVKEPDRLHPSPGHGVVPPGVKFPHFKTYEVKREFLPKGIVMFDWVRIDYASQ